MNSKWYGVRCVYVWKGRQAPDLAKSNIYEERVTIWRAGSPSEAISKAEIDGLVYARNIHADKLDFSQSYEIAFDIDEGCEVFSLVRYSGLGTEAYIDRFFDTGDESQD